MTDRHLTIRRWGCGVLLWASANAIVWSCLERRERRLWAEAHGVPLTVVDRFEEQIVAIRRVDGPACGEIGYRLLAPEPVEPNRRYPVVLFLHGAGQRGFDNVRQIGSIPALLSEPDYRRQYPCFVVAAQCPPGRGWTDPVRPGAELPCDPLAGAVAALDEVLATRPADPGRVYLVGFSMGGHGAWELAARQPSRFAAVVPIAGSGRVETAARLVGVPLRAVHGAADEVVPASGSRKMVAAVRAAGGSPLYDELPGVGHGSWEPAFARSTEVLDWMFARSLSGNRAGDRRRDEGIGAAAMAAAWEGVR